MVSVSEGGTVRWSDADGEHVADVDLVGDKVLTAAVLRTLLRAAATGLHVRWSQARDRVTLMALYDALAVAGITVHPPREDALAAYKQIVDVDELEPVSSERPPAKRRDTGASVEQQQRPPIPASQTSTLLTLEGDTVGEVLERVQHAEGGAPLNHLWIIHVALGWPEEILRRVHTKLAVDMSEQRLLTATATVRQYRCGDDRLPLLCWDAAVPPVADHPAVLLVKEYLHIVHGQRIPEARVWSWMLVPQYTSINLMARRFDDAGLWPSWRGLVRYVTPPTPSLMSSMLLDILSVGMLEVHAGRLTSDPQRHRMHTAHANAYTDAVPVAVWLGEDVFFVVEEEASDAGVVVRIPRCWRDLPAWVVALLEDRLRPPPGVKGISAADVRRNVDGYLAWFEQHHNDGAHRLLRAMAWHQLPLVWRPRAFIGAGMPSVTMGEAAEAQSRMLPEQGRDVKEALAILNRITGIVAVEPVSGTD